MQTGAPTYVQTHPCFCVTSSPPTHSRGHRQAWLGSGSPNNTPIAGKPFLHVPAYHSFHRLSVAGLPQDQVL
ncbi:hypothetical protein L249_6859 [Ophiocordyceps polyrhachis-furcata BCC 54312]|uniref:Uncharacterized protein n=1 Tax=Ophiocordyceps polyrhachis-furcata BCC 54312 TaxID=1330021 RepID=A0A367LJR9_9HYPO|nr:hypothetical protein L249_6859 [Ophiocordyceps polyrhachis-furcata BCC 54312]